jgi:hypothetical protein
MHNLSDFPKGLRPTLNKILDCEGFLGKYPNYRKNVSDAIHCIDIQENEEKNGVYVNYGFQLSFLQNPGRLSNSELIAAACEGKSRFSPSNSMDSLLVYGRSSTDEVVQCIVEGARRAVEYISDPKDFFCKARVEILQNGEWFSFVNMTKIRSAMLFSLAAKYYGSWESALEFARYGLKVGNPATTPYSVLEKIAEELSKRRI